MRGYMSWKDLPRVHDTVGIEQRLDLLHPRDTRVILRVFQGVSFHGTNTVFRRY